MRGLWRRESPLWKLAWAHRLKGGGQTIEVTWNQQAPAMTAEEWAAYSSSKLSVSFADGVCTQTWLVDGSGYNTAVRAINAYPYTDVGHIMYVRYDVFPDRSGSWGAECGGSVMADTTACTADQWNAVRLQAPATKKVWARPIIGNWRSGSSGTAGMVARIRNPVWVNLSVMYGVGNEPAKEEFERQCALNGIDLGSALPVDSGTVRTWRV